MTRAWYSNKFAFNDFSWNQETPTIELKLLYNDLKSINCAYALNIIQFVRLLCPVMFTFFEHFLHFWIRWK